MKPKAPPTGSHRRSGGDTTVRVAQDLAPKLPHERDESAQTVAVRVKPPQPIIAQAAADLNEGRQDTDRGPEMNRLARKLK